jgi:hypothetical protein
VAATAGLLAYAGIQLVRLNTQVQNARRDASALVARAEADRANADKRALDASQAMAAARTAADHAKAETERVKREAHRIETQQAEALLAAQASAEKANQHVVALQAGIALVKAKLASFEPRGEPHPQPVSSAPATPAKGDDDLPAELRE